MIRKGLGCKDRPPHTITEASRIFEQKLANELEEHMDEKEKPDSKFIDSRSATLERLENLPEYPSLLQLYKALYGERTDCYDPRSVKELVIGLLREEEAGEEDMDAPEEKDTVYDAVNRPEHYASGKVECIDWIAEKLSDEEMRGYLKGNVLKYLWRCEQKGNYEQDLRKLIWYAERLISLGAPAWTLWGRCTRHDPKEAI